MKTPEELAKEYMDQDKVACAAINHDAEDLVEAAFLAGYQAAELKAKIEFAAKYDHKSPLQVIAAEYVKRRGRTGPLALLEENRFIDGYEAGLHASQPQWISVKDRLPEIPENDYSNRVLLLRADKFIVIAKVEKCVRFVRPLQEALIVETDNGDPIEEFTHWMPLPEPPND